MKKVLMTVGPTAIPNKVLYSMLQDSISHRSKEYSLLQEKVTNNLKKLINTKNDVLVITSSGTGTMEAVIQNCFSKEDKIVVPVIGKFSEQFAHMAELYGLDVERVIFEGGEAAIPEIVMSKVTKDTKGVFLVHNESSTGVYNDLEAFGKLLKGKDAILVVDSVSGVGGLDVKMDEWGIDVIFTSSQKALMSPAGLAFISLSEKAWKYVEKSTFPKYYFDLNLARKFNLQHQTLTTPAIYTLYAVNEALEIILEEGIENVCERLRKNTKLLRDGIRNLGLELFVKDEKIASPTLTAVKVTGQSESYVKKLRERGIIINGGIKPYSEDVFRIGTMGYVDENDIYTLLSTLKHVIDEM